LGDTAKALDHARLGVALNESFGRSDPVHRGDLAEALVFLGDAEALAQNQGVACRHYREAAAMFAQLDQQQTFTARQMEDHRRYKKYIASALAACAR
jgi:hypothetical protein